MTENKKRRRITIGIDPGTKGGWAVLSNGKFLNGGRMPLLPYGKNTQIDAEALSDSLGVWGATHGVMEHVWGRKNDTPKTAFSFGMASGAALAVLSLEIDGLPTIVVPQVWMRHFGLLKQPKAASRQLADELFPGTGLFGIIRNEGIAEAALMAHWLDMKALTVS